VAGEVRKPHGRRWRGSSRSHKRGDEEAAREEGRWREACAAAMARDMACCYRVGRS